MGPRRSLVLRSLIRRRLVLCTSLRRFLTGLKYRGREQSSDRGVAFLECNSQSTAMSHDASISERKRTYEAQAFFRSRNGSGPWIWHDQRVRAGRDDEKGPECGRLGDVF